jgi:hypothetical protein
MEADRHRAGGHRSVRRVRALALQPGPLARCRYSTHTTGQPPQERDSITTCITTHTYTSGTARPGTTLSRAQCHQGQGRDQKTWKDAGGGL